MKRYAIFAIAVLSFASVGILRQFLDSVPSVLLAFARVAISLAIFAAIYKVRIPQPKNMKMWASFVLSGLFIAIAFSVYLEAFRFATISDISLIGFIDPILVALLATAVLKERVSIAGFAAVALAIGGVWLLVGEGAELASGGAGIFLAVLAMFAGAANTILARWEEIHKAPLREVLFFPFAFAAMFLLIPAVSEMPALLDLSVFGWLSLAAMGAATAAGYYFYDLLLEKWGAHITDLAVRVGITGVASVMGVILFAEGLDARWFAAAGMLLASAYLIYHEAHSQKKKHRKRHGHTH